MEISKYQLQSLLQDVAELGALQALSAMGIIKSYISKSEAVKMVGKADLDHWVRKGLITLIKDGPTSSVVRISRLEIESVIKSVRRPSYRLWIDQLNVK